MLGSKMINTKVYKNGRRLSSSSYYELGDYRIRNGKIEFQDKLRGKKSQSAYDVVTVEKTFLGIEFYAKTFVIQKNVPPGSPWKKRATVA